MTPSPSRHIARTGYAALVLALLLLPACTVGPDYHGPPAPEYQTPARFKNAGPGHWKAADPKDVLSRGEWWTIFHDPLLTQYIRTALQFNQDLRLAAARIGESRSLARVAAADFYPQVTFQPNGIRTRTTNTGPVQKARLLGASPFGAAAGGAGTGTGTGAGGTAAGGSTASSSSSSGNSVLATQPVSVTFNLFRTPLELDWEVDLFGRIRRSYEAARAEAQAVKADYQNMALVVSTSVATNYFALRAVDAEIQVLASSLRDREEALRIARERLEAGLTGELDVTRATAELASNQSDLLALQRTRGQVENALAVLLGGPASAFRQVSRPLSLTYTPPRLPAGLPSAMLERRPDVAAAERQLAAANARIGVAKAAFFPVLSLTGQAGFESADIAQLLNWESRVWTIGANALQPVFQGGRNVANLGATRARYEEAVARYRGQVLRAFQEVEDALSDLRLLAGQAEAQGRAVAASRRAFQLAEAQYQRGAINFTDVLDTQRSVLGDERLVAQLANQRLQATLRLIKALGGDWR